jgi:beta-N-acetylhexosaminidase
VIPAASRLFGVGIGATALTPGERAILERDPPRAIILFRRNVEAADQLSELVSQIRALPGAPLLCLDQEGGPVDRLRDLVGPFPSFRQASRASLARRAGELAGEACARFGIDIDLAPVVDRRLSGASDSVLGERTASEEPGEIVAAARQFLEGLHWHGVGGCLKHFPGLGRARSDTHHALPVLPRGPAEEELDLLPFRALMDEAGAIMVSHAADERDGVPASLSPATATGLLRGRLGFSGAAFSDDLEMGALAGFGDLPRRSAAASRAGCDLLFVCSRLEEYPECVERVAREVPELRREEAAMRVEAYAALLRARRRAAAMPLRPLETLAGDVRRLVEAIERAEEALRG